jgi:hypothetical protein
MMLEPLQTEIDEIAMDGEIRTPGCEKVPDPRAFRCWRER